MVYVLIIDMLYLIDFTDMSLDSILHAPQRLSITYDML